jgi:lipopolysaccharide/colanic/teichoic acid biosynthesis glycosyltransferase
MVQELCSMKTNNAIRMFDIIISVLFIIILLPLILIIYFLILFIDGKPVIFLQSRVGLSGKKFNIYKFRTMKNKIYKNESDKLTKLGKILRRLSLDEIPQFFNVIKKEMSIVGPRPLPETNERKIKNELKIKRRKILPGITGLSQINYTGKFRQIDDKVKLDIRYYENYTLHNYLKIITKTPLILIKRLLKNKSSIIK